MKTRNFFNPFVTLCLLLLLGGGVLLAGQARAQAPSEPITLAPGPEATLGSAFTYQGRLLDGGTPVDGACDFEFSLWDDPSAGSQIGTTQSKSGVTVSDGYFGVSLDFGVTAFDGEARYLDITVDCSGGSTPLSPRVSLSGAPYAHSLRPGAIISGTESTGLKVQTSAGGSAQALLAYASSQTGQTSGVWGSTNSVEGGVGVVGRAEATSGTAYGLFGISFSAGGTGVYGTAPTTGTVGIATGSGGYGVYGKSISGHGVHGKASPPDGYALYSEGNTYIDGELFWLGKTSHVAVSAAAFHPFDDSYMFTNTGNMLTPKELTSAYYNAPVQLPQGAQVTRVRFYWNDISGDYSGTATLYRNNMADNDTQTMASVSTTGSSGDGSSETTNITDPTIDNSQYAYYIEWNLGGGTDVSGYGVIIEYVVYGPY